MILVLVELVEFVLALKLLFAVCGVLVAGLARKSAQSTAAKRRIWIGAGSERLDSSLRSSGSLLAVREVREKKGAPARLRSGGGWLEMRSGGARKRPRH